MDNCTPKNLQDLLKFAINQQNDGGNNFNAISEEKKIFLEKVLQSMSVNVIEEFLKAIRILEHHLSSDKEKCDALDLIRDYIDNMDFANNFIKMEGGEIIINCIKHANKSVQINAIIIVAELCQNNSFCQQYFLNCDIIKLLVKYLNSDDYEVVSSALYALSALVRNFEPALAELSKNDGLRIILKCLNMKNSRVFVKTCFLISSISSEFSLVRDEFVKLGALNIMVKNLKAVTDFDAEVELLLLAMSVLMKSSYSNPSEKEKVYIAEILKSIVTENVQLPQCQEIVCYSNSILDDILTQ